MPDHFYGILVRAEDMKRAEWLTPRGTLTTRRLHAGMAPREAAEATAARLREDNPGVTFTVRAVIS